MRLQIRVLLWGFDANGVAFTQPAFAVNLSRSGALFTGIEATPRCGDLVGVQYQNRQAKFQIVWVRDSQSLSKVQAAVQIAKGQDCPWKHLLPEPPAAFATASQITPAT